jgi:prolyl-tRNA editing enzyme YbaK/EbsC (Cys-tRNA(Pro) deacylase)
MEKELSGSALRVSQELRRLEIACEVTTMPESTRSAANADAASALGCDIVQIVKSLIFCSVEEDQQILVLASGVDRVDEPRLSGIVGGPVEQASGKFVRARTSGPSRRSATSGPW